MLSIASRVCRYAPCLCLALCLGTAGSPHRAGAQENNDPANPTLTAHLSNIPFGRALDVMSKGSGISWATPPDLAAKIDPNQLVDVNITGGTFQDVLNSVLDQINPPLAFHLEGNKYVLEASAAPRPNWGRKPPKNNLTRNGIMFHADKTPFEEAMRNLFFTNRSMNYRIDPSVTAFLDPITLSAEDVPFEDVLKQLLDAVSGPKTPLTFHKTKEVYIITAKNSDGKSAAGRRTDPIEAIGLPSYHPIPTIKNVEVIDARPSIPLRLLFQQSNADYVLMLPTGVAALPHVTFAMQNVPLEQAVVHLLRSAPADPSLMLSLLPTSDAPSAPKATDTKPVSGKLAQVKPALIYQVKPDVPAFTPLSPGDYRFSFRFQNANMYDALKALLNGTQANYTLDPGLRETKFTAAGDGLMLEKALDALLSAAPKPMTWKVAKGVIMISDK